MGNEVPGLDHVASFLARSEARLHEQLNSSFNWVLGTLFAANGGALVALLSNDKIAAHPPRFALVCFAFGVVFSIFLGIWNAVFAAKAIMPTTDLQTTIALFAVGQASSEELIEKTQKVANEGFVWTKRLLYASGTLSLLCLIVGMIAFGATV